MKPSNAGRRETGTPLLLRFHVRNREYLSTAGGTPSVCHPPFVWTALLGTATVVSSSTQGPYGFANQGSATVQSSFSGTVTSSLISSGDMQSSPASSTAMPAPAGDSGAQDGFTKTASAATVFQTPPRHRNAPCLPRIRPRRLRHCLPLPRLRVLPAMPTLEAPRRRRRSALPALSARRRCAFRPR